MTITNDGATILKLLEVEHPAAKVLCELADLQDKEVGDGTTSVVSRLNSCSSMESELRSNSATSSSYSHMENELCLVIFSCAHKTGFLRSMEKCGF